MNIAQVVCVFPPYKGGMGAVAKQFAEVLTRKGSNNCDVFTPARDSGGIFISEKYSVNYLKPLLRFGNGAFIPQLAGILKKYELVHLHYPFFGGAESVWFSKITGADFKLAVHFHMDVSGLPVAAKLLRFPDSMVKHSLFRRADAISCASFDYVKNSSIASFYDRYREKFIQIPFGVDTDRFYPGKKTPEEKTKLLFVGGLDKAHYFKGLPILLDALSGLETEAWELKIVGSGNDKEYYEKIAQSSGVWPRIKFLGGVSDDELPEVYRQSDIFILPSINSNEAFGLVILEALASGLPVLASDLPGVREVFKAGKEGVFVKARDSISLRTALLGLMRDRELREGMGIQSRELALNKYSLEKLAINLNDFYENLLYK